VSEYIECVDNGFVRARCLAIRTFIMMRWMQIYSWSYPWPIHVDNPSTLQPFRRTARKALGVQNFNEVADSNKKVGGTLCEIGSCS